MMRRRRKYKTGCVISCGTFQIDYIWTVAVFFIHLFATFATAIFWNNAHNGFLYFGYMRSVNQ